jgi:putative transcriptional regulator
MSQFFDDLMESVQQMDEIRRGERKPSREFTVDALQVKAIRKATGLTQARFAAMIDVQLGTLRNWEQGRREPTANPPQCRSPRAVLYSNLAARPAAGIGQGCWPGRAVCSFRISFL